MESSDMLKAANLNLNWTHSWIVYSIMKEKNIQGYIKNVRNILLEILSMRWDLIKIFYLFSY